MRAWARERDLEVTAEEALSQHPEVQGLIGGEVEAVNHGLASFESIKYFRILQKDFTVESEELTASLKIRRKVIAERHRALIDGMYDA